MRPLDPGLRLLTLLFTDAVSSTEQQIRLGDHRGDELRRERDEMVAREIERSHGAVVKSTGDGVFAAFSSPSEAISCAVAVQRALAHRNRTATEAIGLRVGMATGEVIVENGDVYGRAANESARITARASADEILCCGLTRQLAAPRSTWRIESAGEALLKGFDVPSALFRVDWAEVSAPLVPLPAALALRRPFVGRTSVLAAASEFWTTTTSTRRPHLMVVGGEPGVGKTSVLARLADDVFHTGATVLYGRCSENDIDSLRPIREALAHYVNARRDSLAGEFGSGQNELVRLVPELERSAGVAQTTAADHREATAALFESVAQWLAAASRLRPVLFVIDDAQWLDGQTTTLLRRLVEESHLGPLLLAVARRDHDPTSTGEVETLIASLRNTNGSLQTMRLTGLSGGETTELVELLQPLATDQAERLHRDSGGNPLYLGELLRVGPGENDRGQPRGVAGLVLQRVDRLPPACVELLEAAAVLGQEFDVAAIEQVLSWPPDDTYKVLDGLVRNDLLREPSSPEVRFEFAHAIVRESVYDRLTKVRRLANHRRAAEALEHLAASGRPIRAREIARHRLEAATSGGMRSALTWCRKAATEATDRLSYEEAGRWFDAGLDLFDRLHPAHDSEYLELLIERAIASQRAGERGTRGRFLRAAEVARQLGDGRGLIRVALAFDRGFFATLGRADQGRSDLLRQSLAMVIHSPSERACLLALLASELAWDDPGDTRFALSDEALELARGGGDPATLMRVLSLRPPTIWSPDTYHQVVASVDELGALTVDSDDRVLMGRYLTFRFGTSAEGGDFRSLTDFVDRLAEIGWFLRLADALWHAATLRANLALFAGRLSDARTLAQESLEWGQRAGQPEAMLFYAAIELEVRRLCGGLDELIPLLESGRPRAADGAYSATRLLYEAGHATAAREDYTSAVRTQRTVSRTINGGPMLVNLSFLASRFEDVESARRFLELLEPYGGRFFQAIMTHPVTDHYRGMLAATAGHHAQAADLLRRAVDLHEQAGAPLLAAESRLEWARVGLLAGRWSGPAPVELVDAAIGAADECDAPALAQRAREMRSRV